MRIRTFAGTTAVLLALSALAACSSDKGGSDKGGQAQRAAKDITVGEVSGSAANPAVQVMDDAMKARAKALGVKLYVETSESVEQQIEKAEALMARGVDYLGLHPWDGEAIKPLVKSAKARGVKVVILIDGVPGAVESGDALTFISGNELAAAEKIGKWVAQKYRSGAEAAIITGTPGNLSAINRTNGFKKGITGSSVKVVAESTANWARDEALRVAGDIVTAHPRLNVIFGNNDEMAFGALKAVNEAGKKSQITVIGWNGTCIGLQALLKGDFALEAVLPFDVFGAGLVNAAVDSAAGKNVPKMIAPEVPVLTTQQAKDILAGKQSASAALVARLTEANAGACK
jgi:ABC-type sugar transport system substrate-binding protein